jgi:hypothetical protein
MKYEFPEVYFELIQNASDTLIQHEKLKIEEIEKREIEKAQKKSNLNSKLSSMFMSRVVRTTL